MDFEKVAICSLGVQIYCRNAKLFRLPSIQKMKFSMPALVAVAAAHSEAVPNKLRY